MSAVAEAIQSTARVVPLTEAVELNPRPARGSVPDDLAVSFVPMAAVEAGTGRMDASAGRTYAEVKKGYTFFREGDVLFAKITPCMENGKMAVARGLRNGVACGSTEFHVLRPRSGVNPCYVYYFVSGSRFRADAAHHMTGAVGQKRVPASFLASCQIPLPTLDEQHRIVAEIEKQFSRLDEAVANLNRVKVNLKRYKAAVLKAAVEGRLVPTEAELARCEERDYESGGRLLRRLLDTRKHAWTARGRYTEADGPEMHELLPDGWTWATVDQLLVSLRNGLSRKPENSAPGLPILRISAVRPLELDVGEHRYYPPQIGEAVGEYVLRAKDLLFVRYNGTKELVGACALVGAVQDQLLYPDKLIRGRVVAESLISPGFLAIAANVGQSRKHIDDLIKTTAGQQGIAGGEIKRMPIPLPPVAEQQRIVAEVDRRLSIIREVEAAVDANLKRAQALRQATLARAFAT
ncbi:restriction endonuclease subunit S [Accumulibacter sp.]|uniref:restriction endonuclease subunit S n=1 Tax=Accumulibacter sp. TaxID=2053492 RepID=UPI0025D5B982|nr:restriction endonuclease subunit S [Accumulibacter sp.]MCP5227409.1 restriction endonuclease subunit S [Accumulibacter sp.]